MMKYVRLALVSLLAMLASWSLHASTWPTQTVRFVVPTPAGSSVDVVARIVAEQLGTRLGQTVIVENKGGAGGTIGADAVVKSRDGHTFFLAYNGPVTVAPAMFPKLPYSPQRDLLPIIMAVTQPNVLAVRADLKVDSLKALLALAKSKPGKIDYASVGNGSLSHLAMEMLKMKSDAFLLHIPFNGGPAAALALGRGDVQVLFAALSNVQPLVRDGKVKLLAVSFGPAGVGQAGNFRQLVTVLGVLAGAGIFNGVTKYVAQYHDDKAQLRTVVGTSSAMVLGFSTMLAVVFLLAAAPISQGLFGHTHYQGLVRLVALVQMGIAWANLLLALMKGFRDAAGNALALILGSIIGVIAYYFCYRLGGYEGALLGLALVPALVVIPAAFMLMRRGNVPLNYLKPQWDKMLAGQLGKFTLMALITSVTLPVAYVMMRNLLAAHYSWDEVGIWQGVSSISDAYLQFITASFSVYLLPTLSRLTSRQDITREIFRSLRFVLPAVAIASFTVWLLRDFAIWLLFSAKFTAMRDLFAWQLVGDVLKVGAYVFGYLVIAKASLRLYILAEIGQFALLTAFSHWLIPTHGALGAAQAYMATYIVYFAACCGVFLLWRKRA